MFDAKMILSMLCNSVSCDLNLSGGRGYWTF